VDNTACQPDEKIYRTLKDGFHPWCFFIEMIDDAQYLNHEDDSLYTWTQSVELQPQRQLHDRLRIRKVEQADVK